MTKKQIRDLQQFAVELAREGNTKAAKEVLALITKAAWLSWNYLQSAPSFLSTWLYATSEIFSPLTNTNPHKIMSRPSSRQLQQFEAELHKAANDSVRVTDTLLAKLAARRDAYLAQLRWSIMKTILAYFAAFGPQICWDLAPVSVQHQALYLLHKWWTILKVIAFKVITQAVNLSAT